MLRARARERSGGEGRPRRRMRSTPPGWSLVVNDGVRPIPYQHAVRRGKWLPDAIRAFAPLGIKFDRSKRPVESELKLWWERTLLRRWLGRAWTMAFR